jgi:pimeloyl-ACP methyl ester carboxylesterase
MLWSPTWRFDDATYARTAVSFDNPDFVDIVIHSYRHRFGYAPGDPNLEEIERRLAAGPSITVPTIVLHGGADGVDPAPPSDADAGRFTGVYSRQVTPGLGHNLPQEAPEPVVEAIRKLLGV